MESFTYAKSTSVSCPWRGPRFFIAIILTRPDIPINYRAVEWTPAPLPAPGPRALLVAGLALMLVLPLGLRGAAALLPRDALQPSYLPALEASRVRVPFRAEPLRNLDVLKPRYAFIGDSMLGTRIDEVHFSVINNYDTNALLFHPATGPAWWYLAFKNYVVASTQKPDLTFVFFRDYQLTETMFRLSEQFRGALDEVAHESEPALNAIVAANVSGPYFRLHSTIERLYDADRVHTYLEPRVLRAPALLVAPDRATDFPREVNTLFQLDRLRPFTAADVAQIDESLSDFEGRLPISVLPTMVKLARANGLRLCFVRVKRRPGPDGVSVDQPEALRRYMAALRHWLTLQGQFLIDDSDDPRLTLDMYADGDHVRAAARDRYTEIFNEKVRALRR